MEIIQYIVEILGPVGLSVGVCLWVMNEQKKQNQALLDFMLDQIRKQTEVLETIREQMIGIKDDLNNMKEGS